MIAFRIDEFCYPVIADFCERKAKLFTGDFPVQFFKRFKADARQTVAAITVAFVNFFVSKQMKVETVNVKISAERAFVADFLLKKVFVKRSCPFQVINNYVQRINAAVHGLCSCSFYRMPDYCL